MGHGGQMDIESHNIDDDGHVKRNGNMWTASAHIITAVIGSGVLSLAWAMAQLGWIAGPSVLLIFSMVTMYTSTLLADCYRTPDPVTGKRNYTYMDAVRANLGKNQIWLCGLTQYGNLFGTGVGYTLTAGTSMAAINRSNCFHKHGKDYPCHPSNNPYMIAFGVAQLLLSQIPDLHGVWWVSVVAAIMSFSYSSIGVGLSIAKVADGNFHGTVSGVPVGQITSPEKVWRTFQAIGNIAFAYAFSVVLIEIQDTIKSPPAENKTMKKAATVGVTVTTIFYALCGVFGYLAFGNHAPGNLLTGFGFYEPYWLVDFANACIVVHLVGAYQVYTQPVFSLVETFLQGKFPKSFFGAKGRTWIGRLVFRTIYVICTTVLAMLLPFFNDVMGLLGAIVFWPLTVYFPTQMYMKQHKVQRMSTAWIGHNLLSAMCLIVSIAAAIGSVEGIIDSLTKFTPFKTKYI